MVLKNIIAFLLFTILSEAKVLDYLNSIRLQCGAAALKLYSKLNLSAQKHARYIAKNQIFSHYEVPKKAYFFAYAQWNRLEKVKMNTIAVNENLSFYNKTFKDSINQLMATLYHRLSFLDERVDIIGYAKVKHFYVYELSNSKLDSFCKNANYNGEVIICAHQKRLPRTLFTKAINDVAKKSKPLIIYPFNGQRNVPTTLMQELPAFSLKKRGFAISVIFNRYYFSKIRIISFKLFHNKKEVLTKIVTKSNDRAKKLEFNQVVLLPLSPLQKGQRYDIFLHYSKGNKSLIKKWHFFTKN